MQAGQTLLHYRIVEKIGEGGMGVAWRAVDTTLNRDVAVKILPDEIAADPERLDRLAEGHPNIDELLAEGARNA
jgi:serine/threonine protein kinase